MLAGAMPSSPPVFFSPSRVLSWKGWDEVLAQYWPNATLWRRARMGRMTRQCISFMFELSPVLLWFLQLERSGRNEVVLDGKEWYVLGRRGCYVLV